jgi:SAM-dependent methyltransferase
MLRVSSSDELAKALRMAPEGSEIVLPEAVYRVAESLALARRLTLRGCDPEAPPLLIFADGRCDLSVTGAGCRLENLALSANGHRGAPLVRIAADGCRLVGLTLLRAQGSGLRLEHCHDTIVQDLVAQELGQEAVAALSCGGLRLSLRGRDLGQRHTAAAIRLVNCRDFQVEADIASVSGSAVAIEATENDSGPIAGEVGLRAQRIHRALSLLGSRDAPVSGLIARIRGHDWSDVAVLLSNAGNIQLHLAVPAIGGKPAVRINGSFGLRHSTVLIAHGDAEEGAAPPPGLVTGADPASNGNVIEMRRQAFGDDAVPAPLLPEVLCRRLQQEAEPTFHIYEQAGRCSLCGWEGLFRRTHRSERETLACGACHATLRYRGQAQVICERIGAGRGATLADLVASGALSELAIYEPGIAGPLRPWLSQAGRYEQSVYDPTLPSGTRRADGFVCQDLMATAFADASFDLVVTSDIFEHIRRPFVAFAEIRRILKPGGLHVWTVPIGLPPPAETRGRVDTSGPEDHMLLPPVYHGSGADGLSLVYTDFGRDIGRLLDGIGLPTQGVRHVAGEDDHIVGVTFVSTRRDAAGAAP